MTYKTLLFTALAALIFNRSYAQSTFNIQWQRTYGGSNAEQLSGADKTSDGGFLLCGSTLSADGNLTGNFGQTDAWLIKINEAGVIEWQKNFGGQGDDFFRAVKATPDGGCILFGSTKSKPDGSLANKDSAWLVKLDAAANIQWQRRYGYFTIVGSLSMGVGGGYMLGGALDTVNPICTYCRYSEARYIKVDNQGSFEWMVTRDGDYVAGYNTKILPSVNGYWLTGTNECMSCAVIGSFVQRIYQNGATGLIREYRGVGMEVGADILGPNNGNKLYLTGAAYTLNNGYQFFYSTIDTFGNILTKNEYGGSLHDQATTIIRNNIDSDFIIGGVSRSNNGQVVGNHGGTDIWLIKVNDAGDLLESRCLGGSGQDTLKIILPVQGGYMLFGTTTSNNGDVSGNHGGADFWVIKLLESANTITGNVFIDVNKNGIKDAGESAFSNLMVQTAKNATQRSTKPINGVFKLEADTGTYTTSVLMQAPFYYQVVPLSEQSTFNSYNNVDTINFALQPIDGKKDLEISVIPLTAARPGFNASYKIVAKNTGTEPIYNVTVRFIKDSRVTVQSAIPAYNSISTDTLIWNFPQYNPLDSTQIGLVLTMAAPPILIPGDTLRYRAEIEPKAGDETPANNAADVDQFVTGSFDPNDKVESHNGSITNLQYAEGENLNYTIRFQNVGNDTAFTIVIRDTLDSKLNSNSFQMLASSHAYMLDITGGRYLTWTFNNIQLPDSNVNKIASNGFISFHVKPAQSLNVGDSINNAASIYFDFNPPVTTNTTITAIRYPMPPVPVISGLQAAYCSNAGMQNAKLVNLPPASIGVTATVKLDATILPIAPDSSFSFDPATLTGGVHTIFVTYANSTGSRTTTHDFINTIAVTPDVSVSANITTITNLSSPVILTCVNTAGGGTAPLYTFAKDRNFATIIQAEGALNTATINPIDLMLGDNWFYVRMKSNATCIITQVAVDSIKLTRDMATGITDPGNPAKIISLFPNPFTRQLYVNGLDASKTYTIYISNINGQVIDQKRVNRQTNVELDVRTQKPGIYLVSIYDERRKLLLGSVKLVKQ